MKLKQSFSLIRAKAYPEIKLNIYPLAFNSYYPSVLGYIDNNINYRDTSESSTYLLSL